MATLDDVRRIAMALPRTSEHLIMCVPKKVSASYLESQGPPAAS
jgi:hypothetical protein